MPQTSAPEPGLCGHCANARVVVNRRGSRFYRCALSDVDARFPRYPPLPVIRCAGHREGEPVVARQA
ncbi:MAG: hypothetical protein ACREOJ_02110 [Gemmatimonadaceae bacterium]